MNQKKYYKEILQIGLPITLQSIFQASYSLIDQLMVGQLGTTSIAGSGLGSKFSSLFVVTMSAVSAVSSILISQYYGKNDKKGVNQSFFTNLYVAFIVMLFFAIPSMIFPEKIMHFYTNDVETYQAAAEYLFIIAISFVPVTGTMMFSSFLRSIGCSKYPLYASIISMFINIIGNYILIFGKLGFPVLGLRGAAISTLVARILEMLVLFVYMLYVNKKLKINLTPNMKGNKKFLRKIFVIMLPILLNEFLWSLGENIYAMIYGRLGTASLAAMTITNPLQGLFVGMFTGISSAAIVMIGFRLGEGKDDEAYNISKVLMKTGFLGSLFVGFILLVGSRFYVQLFNVDAEVKKITCNIIYVFAFILFVKVLNMIIGGGVLRSGGNTKLTLMIDIIGTWIFGIPLGLLAAFVFHLPVYWVYFILSLEEIVRLILSLLIFKKKTWMQNLTES